jgi:cob(I)alamin adenosyltransferase
MTRIYTRTGDDGTTGLFGGPRVGKDDLRVSAYGEVDELCSALGLARSELGRLQGTDRAAMGDVESLVDRLQAGLFVLGAELATPDEVRAKASAPSVAAEDAVRLEKEIDRLEAELPQLTLFILPGGAPSGAALHLARAVCRRAERAMVRLSREERVSGDALAWVNRLGDLLFVLARAVNHRLGEPEVVWRPK